MSLVGGLPTPYQGFYYSVIIAATSVATTFPNEPIPLVPKGLWSLCVCEMCMCVLPMPTVMKNFRE